MRSKLTAAAAVVVVAFLLVTNPVVSQAAGHITGKQIKNNSVTGKDINESTLGQVPSAAKADTATTAATAATATSATTAGSVGSLPAAQVQDKGSVLFGTVEPAGTAPVLKRARGVVSVERAGTGYFDVKFNRDVSNCAWFATYGKTSASVGSLFATTRASSSTHAGDPTWMAVVIFNDTGAQVDGDGFSVLALCP